MAPVDVTVPGRELPSRPSRRIAYPSWAAASAATAGALVALLVPAWRSPIVAAATWLTLILVITGIVGHRPRAVLPWGLFAVMVGCWALATTLVQVEGDMSVTAQAAMGAGQGLSVILTVIFVHRNRRRRVDRADSVVDSLVIVAVLALVGVQVILVARSWSGAGRTSSTLVVPTIDVALAGLLLRAAVVHARLPPALRFGLAAAFSGVLYDLFAQIGGNRLPLPGDLDLVLGTASILLYGAAALHPTMDEIFDPGTFVRRPPSAAFLGLLPLVVVPIGLWSVARQSQVRGLPTGAFLLTGAVVAGLCLIRGAVALRQTEYLAGRDALTELPNRRGLARAYAEDAPPVGWSVLMVDIDDFNEVNDTHGHDVGDALLLVLRDRLLAAVGERGVVARFGGDEFVVLIAAPDADGVAHDLLGALRQPVEINTLELAVSASVGIALAPSFLDRPPEAGLVPVTLSDLVTRGDIAMYVAKGAGGNRAVTFAPEMRDDVARRYSRSSELKQLLTAGATGVGSLEVYYQPLVELRSGVAVGAEALVRWQHPEHGLLQPGDFLDLVHRTGLDRQLDRSILCQVVGQLARWRREGRPLVPVSVNLTLASLADPGLGQTILDELAAADVPAALLAVEITEHEELPDDGVAAAVLDLLHQAGIAVHLDDYGIGYTSLDYLARFPIAVIKLDRSVVSRVTRPHDTIVAAIAAMSTALAVDVLAEGVETAEERSRLVELGIRFGQGYLFDRPMPADRFAEKVLGPAVTRAPLPPRQPAIR